MDEEIGGAFFRDGSNLNDFLKSFHLEVALFLSALRASKAIATGVSLVYFMAGCWKQLTSGDAQKALVMDILCSDLKSAGALQLFLQDASFIRDDNSRCCHHWGEWHSLPMTKRFCMSKGSFRQRAVHIIVLRRSPIQTILSRVYGSMPGVYLNGGGHLVSLFPYLTFVEKKCWLPCRYVGKDRSLVATKYHGWKMVRGAEGTGKEIGGLIRRVNDNLCWKLIFDREDGRFLRVLYPSGSNVVVTELQSSTVDVARPFPTIRATMNRNGDLFDSQYWLWEVKK